MNANPAAAAAAPAPAAANDEVALAPLDAAEADEWRLTCEDAAADMSDDDEDRAAARFRRFGTGGPKTVEISNKTFKALATNVRGSAEVEKERAGLADERKRRLEAYAREDQAKQRRTETKVAAGAAAVKGEGALAVQAAFKAQEAGKTDEQRMAQFNRQDAAGRDRLLLVVGGGGGGGDEFVVNSSAELKVKLAENGIDIAEVSFSIIEGEGTNRTESAKFSLDSLLTAFDKIGCRSNMYTAFAKVKASATITFPDGTVLKLHKEATDTPCDVSKAQKLMELGVPTLSS